MTNILNVGAGVAGSLGLKGFLTLCCLTVGVVGMSYGIKTSNKLNVLIEKVEKYEKEDLKIEAKNTNNDMMDKVNDMYDVIKSLEEQAGSDEKLKTLISDLKNIQDKIDTFGIVYDEARDSGLEKFISHLQEFKEALTKSHVDFKTDVNGELIELSKAVNKLSGDLSRKMDHFSSDFEQKTSNLENGLNELKTEVSEIKDEVLNNQNDITDINNAVFDLNEKIDCLSKRSKREEVAKPETAAQTITETNAVDVEFSTPAPVIVESSIVDVESSTPVEVEAFDQSNLIEFTQVNTHKDIIRGQVDSSEIIEENPIQLENIEGKTIEHNIGLIEIGEDSGTEILTGYHEIEVHLESENSILVVNSTEENAEIGVIEESQSN